MSASAILRVLVTHESKKIHIAISSVLIGTLPTSYPDGFNCFEYVRAHLQVSACEPAVIFKIKKERMSAAPFLIFYIPSCTQCFTEALEMNDLPGSQEFDHIIDIGIVRQTQNVVIGNAGFLLSSQILREIGDDIALYGHGGRIPRKSGGGRGVNASGVVYEVCIKAGGFDVLFRKISGELVDDGADHLQMTQFLSAQRSIGNVPKYQI